MESKLYTRSNTAKKHCCPSEFAREPGRSTGIGVERVALTQNE